MNLLETYFLAINIYRHPFYYFLHRISKSKGKMNDWAKLASGWDFFGIPNRDFYSELDRKIRKSRYPGNWDQHLKSRKKNPDNPEIPGIVIGILKPLKNRGSGLGFENPEWKSSVFGIFHNFGIFIPRFSAKSPGFGIFWDFLPSGYPVNFSSPCSGLFSVGWDIPTKSHLWCLRLTWGHLGLFR